MKYADIDYSKDPIVIVRINPMEPTDQQFDEYLSSLDAVLGRMKRGALIIQISQGKFLPSEKRIKLGNWSKINTQSIKEKMVGLCYINSAFLPATILKGILLVNTPPVPYTVVKTEEEAFAWAGEKLKPSKP
jgi:hypothetical protein